MKRTLIHPIGRAVLAGAAPAVLIALVILVMTVPRSSAASMFASPLPTPTPPQPRKVPLPDISVVIAKSGGRLISTDGQVTVAFPSGAIKEPMTATLSFNVPQIIPARLKLIGSVFVVDAQPSHSRNIPKTITVRHVPPAGVNENELMLVYYDTAANKWLPLPTTMDAAQHAATATTDQSGSFALAQLQSITSLPSNAVIVDDLDTSHFAQYGNSLGWHGVSGPTNHYYLGHMYWTSNTYSVLDNYAIWTPALSPGSHQVYAFIDWDNATTQNARYQIVHNGQTTVYPINQNNYYAEWVSLGTYDFSSSPSSNYVRLEDVTGETNLSKRVGFDAIGFVPNKVYLPLILNRYPPIKIKSGIHLGSRPNNDWNDPQDFLRRLRGTADGDWPAAVMVLSSNVYNIERNGPGCTVSKATVKSPWVFSYLTQAARVGTKVLIRLYPSPGNFADYNDPAWPNHRLLNGTTPAGSDYCNGRDSSFRAINDLAAEMNEIYKLNVNQNGWDPISFFFLPANEPNIEWYSDSVGNIRLYHAQAWQDMDAYFAALYDNAKSLNSNLHILTPPMAQGAFAETARLDSCVPMTVSNNLSGYDLMPNAFGDKNDGYSWNNYWRKDRESWVSTGNPCPGSHHISQYFPAQLQTRIASHTKPAFVTEADLFSPCLYAGNPVTDKNNQPTETQESLWQFTSQEQGANYVIAWLLSESPYSSRDSCPTGYSDKQEIKWHQAYRLDGSERNWFWPWWSRPEQ